MERVTKHFKRRIDKQTLLDLLFIAYEQGIAANKIADATESEFNIPYSEELFSIVLDALGVPDGEEHRAGLEELFYNTWLLDDEYETVESFYDELIFCIEEFFDVDNDLKQSN
ncbi:hypothetical protein CWC22_007930 [Pseudoalteromonas rubra]|uniref:Uncharacterized protein n=1 Tax=Pseudoalteromonas rubra TaxID=43658 RepID=A0A5S3UUD1_9GAMM|nr:hypothetical protein [Pseudoalteromonas rubra]QPB82920.1 hypothetical protein CWC22_007930 [Pseudoalteromonas rubra]